MLRESSRYGLKKSAGLSREIASRESSEEARD